MYKNLYNCILWKLIFKMKNIIFVFTLIFISSCGSDESEQIWHKGNLHTHSLWSDGDDFPEMIIKWYKDHNYQFIAISDHNTNSRIRILV